MENFKINDYNQFEQKKSFEEFEALSLDNLEAELSFEQKNEIEQNHEQLEREARIEILDIYAKNTERERDMGELFDARIDQVKHQAEQYFYSEDYDVNFAIYADQEGYVSRPNLYWSEQQLVENLQDVKSTKVVVPLKQKMSNLAQAIGFQK